MIMMRRQQRWNQSVATRMFATLWLYYVLLTVNLATMTATTTIMTTVTSVASAFVSPSSSSPSPSSRRSSTSTTKTFSRRRMSDKETHGGEISIVTGANGYVGREIVYQLITQSGTSSPSSLPSSSSSSSSESQRRSQDIYCLVRPHRVEDEKKFWDNVCGDLDESDRDGDCCRVKVLPYDMLDGGESIKNALQDAYRSNADKDCDVCVYHVASVFGPTEDGVKTARDNVQGTIDLVNTLSNFPGCRLVLTSSMAAVRGSGQAPSNGSYYTHEDWNTVSQLDESNWGSCYQWSKTESERVAWQLSQQQSIPMISICSSFVFGPPTANKLSDSYSISLVRQWLNGKSPVQSRLCVDIRDVARAHIAAGRMLLEAPTSGGGRYIVSTEARVPSQDLADEIRMVCKKTGLGDPTTITYDSTFVGGAIPIGSREVEATERLSMELGIQLRPVTETIRDMAEALLVSDKAGEDTQTTDKNLPPLNPPSRHVLYDIPVSNNGARCRIILYKKGIEDSECIVKSPMDLGGFKSEAYLRISPEGKVPALQIYEKNNYLDGSPQLSTLAESDTVARYLMKRYATIGPSFEPDSPFSNEIARFHDMYLTTIQGCLYKASPPFGPYWNRMEALKEYSKQLYIITENFMSNDSKNVYLCGDDVSLADATLFPSIVFATYMFPKFDSDVNNNPSRPAIPLQLQTWFRRLIDTDSAFEKVYDEMTEALSKWDDRGRWDTIWLAGVRDTEQRTIFDKIIAGEIPASVVKEDDYILAFRDINPAAPAHVLVIPKDRQGLTRLSKATPEHHEILGRLMVAAGEIAQDESLGFGDGARIVINDGKAAGQEVFHLHVHVLGGRDMSWPPG